MNAEERKWREEREKVLEEWSEIELKFREGTPVRIAMARDSVDIEEMSEKEAAIVCQPTSGEEKTLSDDPLIDQIFKDDYTKEMIELSAATPSDDRSFLMCICRPASPLRSGDLEHERRLIFAMSRKPYSSTCRLHWKMLLEFYRTAAGHALDDTSLANECPPMGSHWQIVGFQGSNPATDFRGVGILGLLQLYHMVHNKREDILREMIKLSRSEPNDFPFAAVGLNFTALIINRLKTRELNVMINSFQSVFMTINMLHLGCYTEFCKQWKQNNCTIKDFQTVLNGISNSMRKDPWAILRSQEVGRKQ